LASAHGLDAVLGNGKRKQGAERRDGRCHIGLSAAARDDDDAPAARSAECFCSDGAASAALVVDVR
jgi:hypothetical protein